jgi:hypothetical protein
MPAGTEGPQEFSISSARGAILPDGSAPEPVPLRPKKQLPQRKDVPPKPAPPGHEGVAKEGAGSSGSTQGAVARPPKGPPAGLVLPAEARPPEKSPVKSAPLEARAEQAVAEPKAAAEVPVKLPPWHSLPADSSLRHPKYYPVPAAARPELPLTVPKPAAPAIRTIEALPPLPKLLPMPGRHQ